MSRCRFQVAPLGCVATVATKEQFDPAHSLCATSATVGCTGLVALVTLAVAWGLLHLSLTLAAPRAATQGRHGAIAVVVSADRPLALLSIALRLEAVALDQPLYLHAVLVEKLRHTSDVAVMLA